MQARIDGTLVPAGGETLDNGLTIIAYEMRTDAAVGAARPASDGTFVVAADVTDSDAVVSFRVTRDQEVLLDTGWDLVWTPQFQGALQIQLPSIVGSAFGTVSESDGTPLATTTVRLFRVLIQSEAEIEAGETDARGRYALGPVARDEMVFVRAYDTNNTVIATSSTRMGGGRVDLVIGGGSQQLATELERVLAAVNTLLQGQMIDDLGASQLAHIAGRTGLEPAILATLGRAARLVTASSYNSTNFTLAFVYALIRQGHASTLQELLAERERFAASLAAAIDANVVTNQTFTADLNHADTLLTNRIAAAPALTAAGPSGTSILTSAQVTALATIYRAHTGTSAQLWNSVRNDAQFANNAPAVAAAQDALRLDVVTDSFAPMIQRLLQDRGTSTGQWSDVRALARLSEDQYLALVQSLGNSLPDDVTGTTLADRQLNYTRKQRAALAAAYPTPSVTADVALANTQYSVVSDFSIAAGAAYEMGVTPIRKLQRTNASLFSGFDTQALLAKAEPIERLFRVTSGDSRAATISTLLGAGYDSAMSIVRKGRAKFIAHVGPLLGTNGSALAADIYSRAVHVHMLSMALATRYGKSFAGGAGTGVLSPPALAESLVPDWGDLFGAIDFCTCEQCQSVLSPAAYMVDLLQFLKQRPAAAATSAYSVLNGAGRRPDISEIHLTCENTNRPLPYIDLVNELLERRVVAASGWPQTTWPADELALHPENLHADAYTDLSASTQVFPFSLPYDLWLDETRSYLKVLGVTRADIRAALLSDPLADEALAYERLGLSSTDAAIIAGTSTPSPAELWGLGTNPETSLASVPVFLSRAEITFDELVDLLRSRYIIGTGSEASTPPDVSFTGTSCDLSSATITNFASVGNPRVARSARFLRFRRRTGFSTREADLAIAAVGGLSADGLKKLSYAQVVRQRLGVSLEEALLWWGNLDTSLDDTGSSQFERIFVPRERAASHPFRLNAARTELQDSAVPPATEVTARVLTSVLLELVAGLRISVDEVKLLLAHLDLDGADNYALLASLSTLYRHVSLARGLGVSVGEYVDWKRVTDRNPFDSADPRSLVRFVEDVRAEQRAGLAAADASYVLSGEESDLAPTTEEREAALSALRARLQSISTAHTLTSDVDGKQTTRYVTQAYDSTTATSVLNLIKGPVDESAKAAARTLIDTHFTRFMRSSSEISTAKEKLIDGPDLLTDPADRYAYMIPFLTVFEGESAVVEWVANTMSVPTSTAFVLARELLHETGSATRFAVDTLLALRTLATTDSAVVSTFRRLHKAAFFARRQRLEADELRVAKGWITFDSIPLESADTALSYDNIWRETRELTAIRDRLANSTLFDLVGTGTTGIARSQLVDDLSARSGWSKDDLGFLAGLVDFALSDPVLPTEVRSGVKKLVRAMDLVQRVRLPASTVWSWRQWPDDTTSRQAQAKAVKDGVRGRLAPTEVATALRPVRNGIRERQRDALVDRLRARDSATTTLDGAEKISGTLLVDVSIGACTMTSRIKLALSSIQTFVQRAATFGLETGVDFDAEDMRPWSWMKNYRVWEANRKIFLWPENWIEPELRDDKTPFFREAENALTQDELTDESIDRVYLRYLQNLHQVAQLEVSATCRQTKEEVGADTLHVFARTRALPHEYFWRTRRCGVWTPWEKLDLGIEGDHLIAVSFNGRLHLLWALIDEQPVPQKGDADPEDARDYFRIKLAWSSFFAGQWSPKQVSPSPIPLQREAFPAFISEQVPPKGSLEWREPHSTSLLKLLPQIIGDDLFAVVFRRRKPSEDESSKIPIVRWEHGFRLRTCDGAAGGVKLWPPLTNTPFDLGVPPGTDLYFQGFLGFAGTALKLPYYLPDGTGSKTEPVLGTTPTDFRLALNGLVAAYWPTEPFFFQDLERAFLVTRRTEPAWRPPKWTSPDGVLVDARIGAADVLGSGTVAPPLPLRGAIEWATTASVTAAATAPSGSATSRLLASVASSVLSGVPAVSRHPLTARAEIVYRDESDAELTRIGTSESDRAAVITKALVVPSPAVTAPPSKAVPYKQPTVERYLWEPFYHPYTCSLITQLHRHGVDGLLDPAPTTEQAPFRRQQKNDLGFFTTKYGPSDAVAYPYPVDEFDFKPTGAYSIYNWELFFHLPLLIAQRLVADQRFEEALRWFHAVFNPVERAVPSEPWPKRVWKTRPLFEVGVSESVEDLLGLLAYAGDDPKLLASRVAIETQIAEWRASPFEPHRIARLRLGAYQRFVVMKYIEALIGWGDMLFRRETLESLNEATQCYALALQILGPRPEEVTRPVPNPPPVPAPTPKTFNTLEASGDDFSSALKKIEALLPETSRSSCDADSEGLPSVGASFGFCIPPNEKLLGFWDLVEDRLFKIRNCMNIDGIVRQLPLFEPPIDPALLVRARAAGLDLASVLGDAAASQPIRRFRVLLQKAQELCNDVKALGSTLLAALEKRDGEQLAQIRARQERDLLETQRLVRTQQIEEAKASLAGLEKSRQSIERRFQFYSTIERMIPEEIEQQSSSEMAAELQMVAQANSAIGSFLALIPQTHASPTCGGSEFGGQQLHSYYQGWASVYGALSANEQLKSIRAGNRAMIMRRAAEWKLQADIAAKDLEQVDKQILAQQIRIAVAEQELRVNERQTAQAREVEEHLRRKYTNRDLYDWMVGQVSSVFLESYKLAYDLARQAERAFQFERGEPSRAFIKFGAWESLRKGLLSGDRLALDLRRMEIAYLAEDKRDLELTRSVSLAELDPLALVALRDTGSCNVNIPESFYDADSAGHYMRRIRMVSATVASVAGPHVPVRLSVTLTSHKIRMTDSAETTAVTESLIPIQGFVTSHGRDDAGVFEPDSRDERYLPFEGAGAVGKFKLELPADRSLRSFDYDTISDVVLHVRYTARQGSTSFRDAMLTSLKQGLNAASTDPRWWASASALGLIVSVRSEYPDLWQRLLSPPSSAPVDVEVPLPPERFPFVFGKRSLKIAAVDIIGIVDQSYPQAGGLSVTVAVPTPSGTMPVTLTKSSTDATSAKAAVSLTETTIDASSKVKLTIDLNAQTSSLVVTGTPKHLRDDVVKDLVLVVRYRFGSST